MLSNNILAQKTLVDHLLYIEQTNKKVEIIGRQNFARLVVDHQGFVSSDFYHTCTIIIKILHYPIYSPCDYNKHLYDSLC